MLYHGRDPYSLFTNPRGLKFGGDLKWSHVGGCQGKCTNDDAARLVDLADAQFIVEVGCYVGTSTKVWAELLRNRDRSANPTSAVLAIDAWLGDLGSWTWSTDRFATARGNTRSGNLLTDGRSRLYDQFMLNMQRSNGGLNGTIIPFSTTSAIGARWLWWASFEADLIYVDTAHEAGETALEVALYWDVLRPGGVLAGDDWAWPGVSHDVSHFAKRKELEVHFLGDKRTWYLLKPNATRP